MRANTRALLSDPHFSVRDFGLKGNGACFPFSREKPSNAAKQHARTENEELWRSSPNGKAGTQPLESLDASGIAEHLAAIRPLMRPFPQTELPGIIQPSIAGGTWSIPSPSQPSPRSALTRTHEISPPHNQPCLRMVGQR